MYRMHFPGFPKKMCTPGLRSSGRETVGMGEGTRMLFSRSYEEDAYARNTIQ